MVLHFDQMHFDAVSAVGQRLLDADGAGAHDHRSLGAVFVTGHYFRLATVAASEYVDNAHGVPTRLHGENVSQIDAGKRWTNRLRARGDQQLVICDRRTVRQRDAPRLRIQLSRCLANQMRTDAGYQFVAFVRFIQGKQPLDRIRYGTIDHRVIFRPKHGDVPIRAMVSQQTRRLGTGRSATQNQYIG